MRSDTAKAIDRSIRRIEGEDVGVEDSGLSMCEVCHVQRVSKSWHKLCFQCWSEAPAAARRPAGATEAWQDPWQHPRYGRVWAKPTVQEVLDKLDGRLIGSGAPGLTKADGVVLMDYIDLLRGETLSTAVCSECGEPVNRLLFREFAVVLERGHPEMTLPLGQCDPCGHESGVSVEV